MEQSSGSASSFAWGTVKLAAPCSHCETPRAEASMKTRRLCHSSAQRSLSAHVVHAQFKPLSLLNIAL